MKTTIGKLKNLHRCCGIVKAQAIDEGKTVCYQSAPHHAP